jgi:hypothetical protein
VFILDITATKLGPERTPVIFIFLIHHATPILWRDVFGDFSCVIQLFMSGLFIAGVRVIVNHEQARYTGVLHLVTLVWTISIRSLYLTFVSEPFLNDVNLNTVS